MAAASSATVTIEPQEMECPVCHEEYTEPKILPCAHLLCQACLVSWLKTHDDAQCPLCRCAIVDPKHRAAKSCEELAMALPTDLSMAALVGSARTLGKDHVCCVCDDVAATSICLECGDMFCQACTKLHQKQSATRHHTVEELASMTAERLAASQPTPCATHNNEPSKLFCPTHGVSVCLLCATSKHRACPEVTDLQERVQEARKVLGGLAATLKTAETELERAIGELDEHLKQAEKTTETNLAEISAACDSLQSSVENLRRSLRELALKAKEDCKTAVHGTKTNLMERRGKMTSHRRLVERAQQSTPPTSFDDVKATLQTRVTDLDCHCLLPGGWNPMTVPILQLDRAALTRLAKEIEELGQIQSAPASISSAGTLGSGVFCFHVGHGRNIELSKNNQTAKVKDKNEDYRIVVSDKEMLANRLYEVNVDINDNHSARNYIWTGVTNKHPSQLYLPHTADGWKDAIVINYTSVDVFGKKEKTGVGKKLPDIPTGSQLGVLVDDARCLHLYINGVDQGVAARDVPQPCYAFFDMFGTYKKVTALPVRIMK